MKKNSKFTPEIIKESFKDLRKKFGIKCYISYKRDLNKKDMSICSRPYGEDFFIDFPMSSNDWGKEIEKIFIEKTSQYEGYRIIWNGDKTSSIKIEKINEEKERQERIEKSYFELIKFKNNDFGTSI